MILSGQSIRDIASTAGHPIIYPFYERQVDEKTGMSWGLSIAGYDIRIKQHLFLRPGLFALASSIERFNMPDDVLGQVADKSSLARKGIAVQNTIIDPGWKGYLTLEITNHSDDHVLIEAGSPIAQIIFHLLDRAVEKPYSGKYQNQPDYPVGPLKENHDPRFDQ